MELTCALLQYIYTARIGSTVLRVTQNMTRIAFSGCVAGPYQSNLHPGWWRATRLTYVQDRESSKVVSEESQESGEEEDMIEDARRRVLKSRRACSTWQTMTRTVLHRVAFLGYLRPIFATSAQYGPGLFPSDSPSLPLANRPPKADKQTSRHTLTSVRLPFA